MFTWNDENHRKILFRPATQGTHSNHGRGVSERGQGHRQHPVGRDEQQAQGPQKVFFQKVSIIINKYLIYYVCTKKIILLMFDILKIQVTLLYVGL